MKLPIEHTNLYNFNEYKMHIPTHSAIRHKVISLQSPDMRLSLRKVYVDCNSVMSCTIRDELPTGFCRSSSCQRVVMFNN
jgi:hypothetical protein